MTNILTADEAALIVADDANSPKLALILPQVDATIEQATGRDWTQDDPINPVAKRAATCRLAIDYDLGAMAPQQIATLERAYLSAITQLEAMEVGSSALQYINSASYVEDMETYLASEALGLNLIDYNKLLSAGKYSVAEAVLNGRPSDGYTDSDAIQAALDTAVKTIIK